MTKVGVVMPVVNQFKMAVDAIESIRSTYDWTPYVIPNYRENIGVAAGWNEGVDRALNDHCTHILIANDDIVLAKNTIDHLVYRMNEDETIGLLSATDYRNWNNPDEVRAMTNGEHSIDFIDAPHFSCFMITARSFLKIGRFDENFTPAYFEDNDYCHRTLLSGMKILRSQNAPFYHYGSQTQNAGAPVCSPHQFANNRNYYMGKWGGLPGNEAWKAPFNNPNMTWKDW